MRLVSFPAALALAATAALAAPIPEPKAELHKPGWEQIDPDKDCQFSKGTTGLTIKLPAKDLDLDVRRRRLNAPRMVRDFEGDFRMEVHVKGNFHATREASAANAVSGSSAGLYVHLGSKAAASLHFVFGAVQLNGQERRFVTIKRVHEGSVATSANLRYDGGKGWPLKTGEAFLRLERSGVRLSGFYSADGKKWVPLGGLDHPPLPEKLKVGIIAFNTSKGKLEVTFDELKLTKAPARPVKKKK
jgi:hypothetical protein